MGGWYRAILLAIVLSCVGMLVACGRSSPSSQVLTSAETLTSVHVVRTNSIPQNTISPYDRPFDVTQTDAGKVRDLYTLMASLKPMPPGTYSCPADLGVEYHVTFFTGATAVITGTIEATGCGTLTLGSTSHWWAPDENFWPQVAADLDVAESALVPVAPVSSPLPTQTPIPASAITALHVERVSGVAENHIGAYTLDMTDPTRAQAVYALLLALPPPPTGDGTCPPNTRVGYRFTFDAGGSTALSALVDEACGFAQVGGRMRWWKDVPNFYPRLASDLGVSVLTLTPAQSAPSGPYAPVDDPLL